MKGPSKRTRAMAPADWAVVAADALAVIVALASLLIGGKAIATKYEVQSRQAERAAAITSISADLDKRFGGRTSYDPTDAGPSWYGFSPAGFPPGIDEQWASDARWNQLDYRPESSAYRYGIYTNGAEAWLMVYGDADRDGTWSQVYRHYAEGRLVHEWRLFENE